VEDLKQRGLLDETLIVGCSEFGRSPWQDLTPRGRAHHNDCFTCFLAGGGVRGGFSFGRSDDHGNQVAEHPVHVHDLHATILHIMGLDHTRLTYRYSGRDFRLTDVHGHVVHEVLA
jgi:arylsulfatase A-like enzyme